MPLSAQTTKPSAASPGATTFTSAYASAGVVNDWLREQNHFFNPFDLGGQFRARFVDQTYFAVPGAGPTAVDFRANTPRAPTISFCSAHAFTSVIRRRTG